MHHLEAIKNELHRCVDSAKAEHSYGFFKAFPGGYGAGDRFLGVTVPAQRKIARRHYREIPLDDVEALLRDPFHECRLTALFVLCLRFGKALKAARKKAASDLVGAPTGPAGVPPGDPADEQAEIVGLYLRNIAFVNNWDLVDSSAPYILGPYLMDRDKGLLDELVSSGNLWKQRIAVMATFYFIRQGRYGETLALVERLLEHPHDLIHKAAGWMLREIGNRNYTAEYDFLVKYYRRMPRTMLRYAIEKFDPEVRQSFLQSRV